MIFFNVVFKIKRLYNVVKPLEICHIKVRLTTTGMKHRHAAIHHHKND
jgi:hypothetical protein